MCFERDAWDNSNPGWNQCFSLGLTHKKPAGQEHHKRRCSVPYQGPALILQCTLVLSELTNKELVRSSLPFPPVSHCTDRAFLHEGHTQHILYSHLERINSEREWWVQWRGREGRQMWWWSPGAAQVPSHGACVTSQTSTASDQTPLLTTSTLPGNTETQTQPGIVHQAGKYRH